MSSAYTKDLSLEIVLKLNGNVVFNISKVSAGWSQLVNNEFWLTKFIRDFGSSLPIGEDYELEYIVLERLTILKFYYFAIHKEYTNLINISLSRYPTNIDIAYIAKYGTLDILKLVLSKQPVPRTKEYSNIDYALIIASEYGRLDIIEFLLANGANIHAKEDDALSSAAREGHLEVVKFLLANGADIHAQEDDALIWAATVGQLEVVKLLIANGANIHAQGDSALINAAANGKLEIVKFLLANGADIHAREDLALTSTAKYGKLEVVKLLLDNGASIQSLDPLRSKNKKLDTFINSYINTLPIPKETKQCSAITLKGAQCKKKAVKNGLCSIHLK